MHATRPVAVREASRRARYSMKRTRKLTGLRSLVLGVALLAAACSRPSKADPSPPPPAVKVATVAREDVSLFLESVGTLDGYVNAEIRARVKGFLKTQDYADGGAVKQGQLLFTIDPSEYENAVAAARASLARAVAARTNAQATLARTKKLSEGGVSSAQELQDAVAAAADADGQVLAAQAALASAELSLSYTKITAPNDGVAGLAKVRAGNLVGQDGPTLLTTVSLVDPIRVNFAIGEADYLHLPARMKKLDGRDLAWAKQQFARLDEHPATADGDPGVELVLADGSVYPHRGVVVAMDRQIDASTGTIQLQALFPNPDDTLRPGQYGRVRMRRLGEGEGALLVPERALVNVQGSYSVAIVGAGDKIELRRVELGASVGGMRIVSKGVAEGDRVVVDGVQKVGDGQIVAPEVASALAAIAPDASARP
jgi:membrane fusion protein (multidrug efflux system)